MNNESDIDLKRKVIRMTHPARFGFLAIFMLRRKTLLVICFVAFAFNESKALLGETFKEIESRYGIPQSTTKGLSDRDYTAIYQTSDLIIAITFIDGKSQKEFFSKKDAMTAFSKDEINALLKPNAGDSQWDYFNSSSRYNSKSHEVPNDIVYRLINHAAWAEYSIVGGPHLSIWSDGYGSYKLALEMKERASELRRDPLAGDSSAAPDAKNLTWPQASIR